MVLDVSNMDPHTLTNINIIDPPTESENEDKLGDDELDIVSDNLEQYANALTILEKEKKNRNYYSEFYNLYIMMMSSNK